MGVGVGVGVPVGVRVGVRVRVGVGVGRQHNLIIRHLPSHNLILLVPITVLLVLSRECRLAKS